MSNYPRLAPTEALERELLIGLGFIPANFKAMWRANPTAMTASNIRAVIRRQWPAELAALEARVMGGPKPAARPAARAAQPAAAPRAAAPSLDHSRFADAEARARLERQEEIQQRMQSGAWAPHASRAVTFDPVTQIQKFGVGVG